MAVTPEYQNFDIQIGWDTDGLTITYPVNKGKPFLIAYRTNNLVKSIIDNDDLKSACKKVEEQKILSQALFDTLFPENSTHGKEFRKKILQYPSVRLRLVYSTNIDTTNLKELLKIPWEYLYIPKKDNNSTVSDFFCNTPHFSLVHCLIEESDLEFYAEKLQRLDNELYVEKLPVNVAFLSAFDKKEEQEAVRKLEKAFLDISEETLKRKRSCIVKLDPWSKTEDNTFKAAIDNYDIVQFLSHGLPEAIYLYDHGIGGKPGPFERDEIIESWKSISNKAKAIILCACHSAKETFGPAITLHKAGVPVVIGLTQSLYIYQAQNFLEDFYTKLAETACNLEEAVAYARSALMRVDDNGENGSMSMAWGLPRVFLASSKTTLISDEALYSPKYKLVEQSRKIISMLIEKIKSYLPVPEFPYEKQIENWIDGHQKVLYVCGFSHNGKSTQIARLLDKRKDLLPHLCTEPGSRKIDDNTNHPLVFIRDSLYPQLEEKYEKNRYRSWIEGNYPIMIDDPHDALKSLVIEPLRRARAQGEFQRPILVIDGLDHAEAFEPGVTILSLLEQYISPLTEVMRLIITADSDSGQVHQRILNLLPLVLEKEKYYKIVEMETPKLNIPQEAPTESIPEVMQTIFSPLQEKLKDTAFFNQIWQMAQHPSSKGEWKDKAEKIQRIVDFGTNRLDKGYERPDNLYLSYESCLKVALEDKPSEQSTLIKRLLKVLAVAYAPIPKEMISLLIGAPVEKVNALLALLKDDLLILTEELEQGVICEHPSVKRFLTQKFALDEAHNLFVKMYHKKKRWNAIANWSELPYSDYAGYYLAEHTYQRYRHSRRDVRIRADDFLQLMVSPGFRAFRLKEAGSEAALEDVRRALRVLYLDRMEGNLQAPGPHLGTIEHLLAAYNSNDNPVIIALERKLRREDGGLNALQEFLGSSSPSARYGGRL